MQDVSAAADTFSAFVDVLAGALDDHEASAEDVAARVHLSRFHFDRVIAATAGEPPGTFRRRVLLERAAYRLVTSSLTILDIAIEAGYGSNEAFSRAFARAYGVAPAQ
jgi:AraC family transcriptional regulator